MQDRELIAIKLELVSAKAKLLAEKVRRGQTWPGDIQREAGEIATVAREVFDAGRDDR